MKRTIVDTYTVYFLMGSNKAYDTTTLISLDDLLTSIKNFQAKYWKEPLSVNVTPNNTIILNDYKESCYRVQAINYPRFPKKPAEINEFMLTLMEYLMVNFDQERLTLVTPTTSTMLENTALLDEKAIKKSS